MDFTPSHASQAMTPTHEQRIRSDLQRLGVSNWGLWHSEAAYLPHVIHPNESIEGIVYGFRGSDFVYLVATDRRIVYINKMPLFSTEQELSYENVAGVRLEHAFMGVAVTLLTKTEDFHILTFNKASAQTFADYIETRCLEPTISPK